ncbi:hypothetical protein ONE63_006375 [Megalurothrips usitatus]|uniref:Uncharacterized protein n=1 Tax=Megalurothrips usitatus TaxID=439358 RepID=A0AAV7XX52_9NEOP|nr:hypothetical protein ONE63_006375 [Megalurothrips usitatus]
MTSCNTSLRMEGRTTVVFDIDLFLDRAASTITKLTVNQTRCRDVVTQSTCQSGRQFDVSSGVCAILNTPLMPWSAFVESMQPPLKCPLGKGFYSGRGISLDMRVARAAMRPEDDVGILYVGRGTVFDQNQEPFMCMEVTTDVVRFRARPPQPSQ